MAVQIKNIVPRKLAASGFEAQYTAVNCTTVIDKMTATNTSAANVVLTIFLVASGDSPGSANAVLDRKYIAPQETYLCPEIVGQVLLNGGILTTSAGTASVLVLSASGREIT